MYDIGPKPVSSANPLSQTVGFRRRFHFAMESARPCLDVGRYLILMRQRHAKGRQRQFAMADVPKNV